MCNLYRLDRPAAEVAHLFDAVASVGLNVPAEVYPSYPGLVVAGGGLRSMVWGFPLALKSKKTGQLLKPKPVNNTRTDKLGEFFWSYSFRERRCLIPVTAFAEPVGPKGGKTRTWFSLPDQPLFAAAGIWRDTEEWGPAYSMVMTEASAFLEPVHNRMPVLLRPEDWSTWTDGPTDAAHGLCRPYQGDMAIERTADSWVRR